MGIASLIATLAPLLVSEIPAITQAIGHFKAGDVGQGVTALIPTLQKAQPVLAAASSSTPPVNIYCSTPGTYNVTVTFTAAK